MRNWLKNVIYAGFANEKSAEVRKQVLISSVFSLISFLLLIIYGLDNLHKSDNQLAFVVLLTAVISGINYLFLCRTGKYRISSTIIVLLMTTLCLYLICTGGNAHTGPLWAFVVPGLVFYILGLYLGIAYLVFFLGLLFYIFYVPDNFLLQAEYSLPFVQRFTGALFSVSVLAYVYEYSREDGRRELIKLSRRLDQLSRKDELTGLANRRDMFERLRNELSRLERNGKLFSVLIADIDHFKSINDTFGHECGDLFLVTLAKIFTENTQKRDSVARWGGEEFLVFLPETTGAQAMGTAERLRRAIEQLSFEYEGKKIKSTVSIGVAEYVPDQTLNELINTADKFLYLAKKEGRNRVKYSLT